MKAWIFDVDGVIANLQTKKVEHPQILEKIAEKLESHEPVGIFTGRTTETILNILLKPLERYVEKKSNLDFLVFEGEFGAASLRYKNGEKVLNYDMSFSPPEDLIEKGMKIISDYKYMVFFNSKKTFYTAEMNDDISIELFRTKQDEIAQKLQKIVNELNLSDKFEVHQDTIAINVKHKRLNKHLATQKFLTWLNSKNLNPDFYYAFGDSDSDFQIGQELFDQNKKLSFIYTGEKEIEDKPFSVIKVGGFDKGALEYLKAN